MYYNCMRLMTLRPREKSGDILKGKIKKRDRTGEASGGAVPGTHVVLHRASEVVSFQFTVESSIKLVPKRVRRIASTPETILKIASPQRIHLR